MSPQAEKGVEILIILGVNLIFLLISALLLWPLGWLGAAWQLARGYLLLWLLALASILLLYQVERLSRVNIYDHFNTYIALGLLGSVPFSVGWGAFAALTLHAFVSQAAIWRALVAHLVGLLSAYVCSVVITTFYDGTIYKIVNLPLALLSYLLFAVWPVAAWALFGWWFAYWGMAG